MKNFVLCRVAKKSKSLFFSNIRYVIQHFIQQVAVKVGSSASGTLNGDAVGSSSSFGATLIYPD